MIYLCYLLFQISYILTPVTLSALMLVLIYGYTAVPDASNSINRLLSSTGLSKKEGEDSGESGDVFDHMLQNKLASPKVCGIFSGMYRQSHPLLFLCSMADAFFFDLC